MSDTVSKAYEIVQRGAHSLADNDVAKGYRIIARAALVCLARDRSPMEAADLARSISEELRTL